MLKFLKFLEVEFLLTIRGMTVSVWDLGTTSQMPPMIIEFFLEPISIGFLAKICFEQGYAHEN